MNKKKPDTSVSKGKIFCAWHWWDDDLKHEIKAGDDIWWLPPDPMSKSPRPKGYCKEHYDQIKEGGVII